MSDEPQGKTTLGQKVKLGLLVLAVVLAVLLAATNWQPTHVVWFPFVRPVELPLTLVCLFAFGAGSAVTFAWISFRTLRRRKQEEKPTLPPAAHMG